MQKAAVAALKDSGLEKELLSKTHVSVREDERKAIAFAFVIELRSIAGSDKGHSSNSFKMYLQSASWFVLDLLPRRAGGCYAPRRQCNAAPGERRSVTSGTRGRQPTAWRRRGLSTMIE
jgi:hypothetical protein